MTLSRLLILAAALFFAVVLAATNPNTDDYLQFVGGRLEAALDRMDHTAPDREKAVIRAVFRTQRERLLKGVVRPATTRSNWGLCSLFHTRIMETDVIVLGVGGWFVPVRGLEEAALKVGRLAF